LNLLFLTLRAWIKHIIGKLQIASASSETLIEGPKFSRGLVRKSFHPLVSHISNSFNLCAIGQTSQYPFQSSSNRVQPPLKPAKTFSA